MAYWWFSALVPYLALPLTPGAPFLSVSMMMLLIVLAICLFAVRTSLGARPMLSAPSDS